MADIPLILLNFHRWRFLTLSSPSPAACLDSQLRTFEPPDFCGELKLWSTRKFTRTGCYTRGLRRLIINADDFGLTSGINRGILESHLHGILTSTTLMACGQKFDEAAGSLKNAPTLSVGCHVVLVDGVPVLAPKQVSTLVDAQSPPRFRQSLLSFACLAALRKLDEGQIEAEVTAQIKKLQAAGIPVSHLDSHKHTHMLPTVLKGVLRAAQGCGIRALRNPFEPLVFASWREWKRHFQLKVLRRYQSGLQKLLAAAGVRTPDGCIGIAATGGLTLVSFRKLLENLPEGTWEFVSHPGYNDAELNTVTTRLRDSRDREREILTAPQIRELIEHECIQLISYHEL
jgi:chitin disaccharide deacetylase